MKADWGNWIAGLIGVFLLMIYARSTMRDTKEDRLREAREIIDYCFTHDLTNFSPGMRERAREWLKRNPKVGKQ